MGKLISLVMFFSILQGCCSTREYSSEVLNRQDHLVKMAVQKSQVIFVGTLSSPLPSIIALGGGHSPGHIELTYSIEESLLSLPELRRCRYCFGHSVISGSLGGSAQDDDNGTNQTTQVVSHAVAPYTLLFPGATAVAEQPLLETGQQYIIFLHRGNQSASINFGAIPATDANIKKIKCLVMSEHTHLPGT